MDVVAPRDKPARDGALPQSSGQWRATWEQAGQPWRTQPEITAERQQFLRERLATEVRIWEGIYPFRDVKLNRADVEWLLATTAQPAEPTAAALDLRGADLRKADLSNLPLVGLRAGLDLADWQLASDEQREMACTHFERVNLRGAHLEGAILVGAAFGRANLTAAHLEGANLAEARLERANLQAASLSGADLHHAYCEGADLTSVGLRATNAYEVAFIGATLSGADCAGATLRNARFEGANLRGAYLGGGTLSAPDLAALRRWRPDQPARLEPVDLRGASFDTLSDLFGVTLGNRHDGFAQLADVRWGDAILTVVNWGAMDMVGDERIARERVTSRDYAKNHSMRISEYETAIRANRQLAITLTAQGLSEHSIRFNYRAQVLQRQILWWQWVWGQAGSQEGALAKLTGWQRVSRFSGWLVSVMLDLLSGYGSKLGRCFLAYVLCVTIFAIAHFIVGRTIDTSNSLNAFQAVALSIQSLHGRNFTFHPTNAQVALNTAEAIVGLVIESLIVAILTRRILGLG